MLTKFCTDSIYPAVNFFKYEREGYLFEVYNGYAVSTHRPPSIPNVYLTTDSTVSIIDQILTGILHLEEYYGN